MMFSQNGVYTKSKIKSYNRSVNYLLNYLHFNFQIICLNVLGIGTKLPLYTLPE